jgi:hypothetical protein
MSNITNEYKKAFVEVQAVLSCLDKEDYNKIPTNITEALEENKDKEYIYNYDENKEFDKWELTTEAKAILYNILKDYLATDEQKEYFNKREKFQFLQEEKEKSEKFDVNNIFKKEEIVEEKQEEQQMVKYKENIFKRILNNIRKWFKIK